MAFKLVFALALMTCYAYGYVLRNECNPPTDEPSSTLSTELPTTTERLQTLKTTETPDQFLPCTGYLTLLLDTGKSLSAQQFENQQHFIGYKLFTSENNFNHYERLSISQYGVFGAQIQEFGFFVNQNDIKEYVNDVAQSPARNANLRRALLSISVAQLHEEITEPLTVAILVSNLSQEEVDDCRRLAIDIQAQRIRLVLIAHGNNVDTSLLAQVTGDKNLVFEWSANAKEPADKQKWLLQLLDCPAQLIQIE